MPTLSGLYSLSLPERQALVSQVTGIPLEVIVQTLAQGGLTPEMADRCVENVLGTYALPYGVIPHVRINARDYLVPMVVEEPSVLAAAASAAKQVRAGGGFTATVVRPQMIGQIELRHVPDLATAQLQVQAHRDEILTEANRAVPGLVARGGGVQDLELREIPATEEEPPLLVVHLLVDCRDAMGANLVNFAAEAVSERLATLTGGTVGLRILSNLCDRRCVRVSCTLPFALLETSDASGQERAAGVAAASRFAERDPYRAATHNKGILNGLDAVVLATGNDWRATEAGAHAFAARSGRYTALSTWRCEEEALVGRMELPLALGTVGGTLRVHPAAQLSLQLLGIQHADELAMVAASVGLASNFSALRALANEGIQRGHMRLHARSVAAAAGATGEQLLWVANHLVERGEITLAVARQVLATRPVALPLDRDD